MDIYEFVTKSKTGANKTARLLFFKYGKCIIYDKITSILSEINLDKNISHKLKLSVFEHLPKYFILNDELKGRITEEELKEFKRICKDNGVTVISPKVIPTIVAD